MGIKHTETSIQHKPKTAEELAAEVETLREENAALATEVTNLQMALCDLYEQRGV